MATKKDATATIATSRRGNKAAQRPGDQICQDLDQEELAEKVKGGDVEKTKIDPYIISKQGAWILHVGESLLPPEIHTIFSLHEADRRT